MGVEILTGYITPPYPTIVLIGSSVLEETYVEVSSSLRPMQGVCMHPEVEGKLRKHIG